MNRIPPSTPPTAVKMTSDKLKSLLQNMSATSLPIPAISAPNAPLKAAPRAVAPAVVAIIIHATKKLMIAPTMKCTHLSLPNPHSHSAASFQIFNNFFIICFFKFNYVD